VPGVASFGIFWQPLGKGAGGQETGVGEGISWTAYPLPCSAADSDSLLSLHYKEGGKGCPGLVLIICLTSTWEASSATGREVIFGGRPPGDGAVQGVPGLPSGRPGGISGDGRRAFPGGSVWCSRRRWGCRPPLRAVPKADAGGGVGVADWWRGWTPVGACASLRAGRGDAAGGGSGW